MLYDLPCQFRPTWWNSHRCFLISHVHDYKMNSSSAQRDKLLLFGDVNSSMQCKAHSGDINCRSFDRCIDIAQLVVLGKKSQVDFTGEFLEYYIVSRECGLKTFPCTPPLPTSNSSENSRHLLHSIVHFILNRDPLACHGFIESSLNSDDLICGDIADLYVLRAYCSACLPDLKELRFCLEYLSKIENHLGAFTLNESCSVVNEKLLNHGIALCEHQNSAQGIRSISRANDLRIATQCFEACCLLDPSNYKFILWSGIASRLSGKFLQSAERLSKILHTQSLVRSEAQLQLCLSLNDMGVEIACNMDSIKKSALHARDGWFLQACNCFKQALSLSRYIPKKIKLTIHLNFGKCLNAGRDFSAAVQQFQLALDSCSNQDDILMIRNLIAKEYHTKGLETVINGNLVDARVDLTRALCYSPEDQDIRLDLALVYIQGNLWKDAERELRSVMPSSGAASSRATAILKKLGGQSFGSFSLN